MSRINANDLKTKGVAAIEAVLAEHAEAIVSVRGKDRFVVMDRAHYHLWAAVLFGLSLGLWWSRHRDAGRFGLDAG